MGMHTTILLIFAVSMGIVAVWAAVRASGNLFHRYPVWPAAVFFCLAVFLLGIALFTA